MAGTPSIKMTAVVNLRPFEQLAERLDDELDHMVDEMAQAIVANASKYAAPYADTTSEMGGYYYVSPLDDTYDEAAGYAESVNPDVVIVPKQRPATRGNAVVANCTAHNVINERGSPATGRPARAMLRRAVEDERRNFPARATNRLRRFAKEAGF